METFKLNRKQDVSGVSGVGIVASGVVLPSGKVIIEWGTPYQSIAIYQHLHHVEAVHCHGGLTEIVWDRMPKYKRGDVVNTTIDNAGFYGPITESKHDENGVWYKFDPQTQTGEFWIAEGEIEGIRD